MAGDENYYQTAVHLIFTMLGLRRRPEVRIAGGRIDTVVEVGEVGEVGEYVYCFEFKLGGAVTADEALRQIDSMGWKREEVSEGGSSV